MNWSDIQIWKQCLISTFICLIGCSIGTMGISFYLISYNWLLVLLISLLAGFITCMIFMVLWHTIFKNMSLKDSIISSYKMSLVSILIMMLTEMLIIRFVAPIFLSHQMNDMSAMPSHNLITMVVAMSLGFVLSLPYNYYQLQKTGKICH